MDLGLAKNITRASEVLGCTVADFVTSPYSAGLLYCGMILLLGPRGFVEQAAIYLYTSCERLRIQAKDPETLNPSTQHLRDVGL